MMNKIFSSRSTVFLALALVISGCRITREDIVLRRVKDVVAEASSDPTLKGEAVFYNPNNTGGKLRNVKVDIFVNGKKAGQVDKKYSVRIPAKGEFSVPFEVKVNMKELGSLTTLLGMLGGKKFDIKYVGDLKLTYKGVPVKVPIDHASQVRISF